MAEVLPLLYLHGLSTSDFEPALTQFLGTSLRGPRQSVALVTRNLGHAVERIASVTSDRPSRHRVILTDI